MARESILRETIEDIQRILGPTWDQVTLERVVFGLFFTGVKLSNGFGGVCYTPIKSLPEAVCCPSSARAMPASGRMKGMAVTSVLDEMFAGNELKQTLGIAVVNALSNLCWSVQPPTDYRLIRDMDATDAVPLPDEAFVVLVGALIPCLQRLKKRARPYCVLEMDSRTLKPDELPFYAPADQAPAKVPLADILVITGTTLINNTLEDLLSLARLDAKIVVVGPTASMLPQAFFRRNVEAIGGVRVTRPDDLLDMIGEAGSGYHFFGKSAEKTVACR